MGAKVTFDPTTYEIQVTLAPSNGIVTLDFRRDVYSDGKEDWRSTDALAKHAFPIRAVGGDPLPGALTLDPTFFVAAPWKLLPFDADHELIIVGNVYREDGASIVKTRAGRTVIATLATTFSAGASGGGGGASAEDVWAHIKALTVARFLALKD